MYFGHPFEARLQNSIQHSVVTCALHADLGREEVMDDRHRLSAVAVLFIGVMVPFLFKHVFQQYQLQPDGSHGY